MTIMRRRSEDIESNTNVTSQSNPSEASKKKIRLRIGMTKNFLSILLAFLFCCCLVIVVSFREYLTFDRHFTFRWGSTVKADPNKALALECLRKTKPDLPDLPYPQDAFEHFQEIHRHLKDWTQHSDHSPHTYVGYSGPWIENHWITHFQEQLESENHSLPDVFGPYIPIFIPWVDRYLLNHGGYKYPKGLASALKVVLREDVLYITVSQNDDGFVARCTEFDEIQKKFHITILSSGGYGHAAIPLLKQPEASFPKIPMEQREHRISYVGSRINAPYNMRERMIDHEKVFYYYGNDWRDVMARSKFSLCPRGYGRTSFHVYETLQMGLIPIFVYVEDDVEWLPYGNAMKDISYSVTIEKLPDLIDQLSTMPDSEIEKMEERIKLKRHIFTYEGVLEQISKFMLNPTSSHIVCNALPSHSGAGHSKPGETILRSC